MSAAANLKSGATKIKPLAKVAAQNGNAPIPLQRASNTVNLLINAAALLNRVKNNPIPGFIIFIFY
jgi:hypothetical protein